MFLKIKIGTKVRGNALLACINLEKTELYFFLFKNYFRQKNRKRFVLSS